MQQRRTNLLLILLVVTPLALLTWLGTYLIRDAARSTDTAMQSVLAERLAAANHQLVHDLRLFTDRLDNLGTDQVPEKLAATLGTEAWIIETWVAGDSQGVQIIHNKPGEPSSIGADAQTRSTSILASLKNLPRSQINTDEPFFPVFSGAQISEQDRSRQSLWLTFARTENYDSQSLARRDEPHHFRSGWHVTDGDFIYWRQIAPSQIVCARLASQPLRKALYSRLPPPGLESYPGKLQLTTRSGIPLYVAGNLLPGSTGKPAASRECSAPLSQWILSYTPASTEFPKPYLFPILLGVGSGCLLVLALAWTFFRENARELRLAQQRVSFVNQISHELKTPLTNIQLYTEMTSHRIEDSGDSIAIRHLKVVETETARLNRLIQNVLNYARQQRDKLTILPKPILLDEVIARAVGNWKPLLEKKGFEVRSTLQGPPQMQADADALEQIVGNLLSNVEKYAFQGKWVAIRTETTGSAARIIIEDRGPGIPSGKRRMVFEAFERLRSDLNEGVSGTGIGLTISRELADLHGGSLEVCSVYKDGARFILTLPIQPV
ncbi:His Kinase A (phospho-acceptor) domain-containing protein [Prosthecobacter debontii]|uniref:histidine kinase n=1 Tax=Prosthecobacter debontii TaxID=48467 RepID=A0A1T4X761_9BACT|nr:HAMP domain-containing sensor histidine kinase [Prosthecobacter debontii]SKA85474.1 His Kinase A (phospho-acceptor) domain-containing protein [Prosthecobacter debontii]